MRNERLDNYKKIEDLRKSKLLVYITSDRQNAETNIHLIVGLFSFTVARNYPSVVSLHQEKDYGEHQSDDRK